MDPEVVTEPGVSTTRRLARWQTVVLGVTGTAVLAIGATLVAVRSGVEPARVVAAPTPSSTTTATTAPPTTTTTVPPTTTTTVAPPPTTTAPPAPPTTASAPAPDRVAGRTAQKVVAPAVPLSFEARIDQAMGATPGCLVVERDRTVTYERNPTAPFVPASAQKLMVGAAILSRVGPDFRYETRVLARSRPGPDGRLDDAWLVGAGDPFLATPDYIAYAAGKPRLDTLPLTPLTALADALVAAGVRDVPGGLLADESRYDTARFVPTWKPSYVSSAEVGSLGALTVNAGFSAWGPNQRVSPDPAAGTAEALTRLLSERGVTAAPPGPAPDGATNAPSDATVVATVRSAPLADIVAATLRSSDNYAAEMFLRELDRQTGGAGTTAGGATRVVSEMSGAGVDVTGVHLNDGSGLDTGNRSTCRALLGALRLSSRPGMEALVDGLAVAGRTGTLVKRFVGTPVEGHLAAKTGWINGAGALVGKIDGARPLRFALVVNGRFSYATSSALQGRVIDVLASAGP